MQMRPEVQLKSVIKALTDVVLPAVDPVNKLAQEQGKLAVGLLALLSQQQPVQYEFDREELERLLAYAAQLADGVQSADSGSAALADLQTASKSAAEALAGAMTTPADLQQAVRSMRAVTGELITHTFQSGDTTSRAQLSKLTLAMSGEQLIRERSMLLMQGWEPDPDAVPPLSELLSRESS